MTDAADATPDPQARSGMTLRAHLGAVRPLAESVGWTQAEGNAAVSRLHRVILDMADEADSALEIVRASDRYWIGTWHERYLASKRPRNGGRRVLVISDPDPERSSDAYQAAPAEAGAAALGLSAGVPGVPSDSHTAEIAERIDVEPETTRGSHSNDQGRYRDPRGEYAVSTNDEAPTSMSARLAADHIFAERALRQAIKQALAVLGTGDCDAPSCDGCAYERAEATTILRAALEPRREPQDAEFLAPVDVFLGEKDGWITHLSREEGKYQHLVIEQTLTSNPRCSNRVVVTERMLPALIEALTARRQDKP